MELVLYYITLFVVSLCATWWIFKKVLNIAILKNIVDNPDERKIQRVPVPVLGGVAVFFGMLVAFAIAATIYDVSNMFAIICVIMIMLYIGTIDDVIDLSPWIRFIIEIIVVLVLIFCDGCSIDNFHGLWGIGKLPDMIAIPLTVFACVGIVNSINLIDGVNGLSSGYCIVTCIIFGMAFLLTGDVGRATLAIISVGALIPFLFHNVFGKKSKMFIGDGGTMMMGIIMSSFVINALKTHSTIAAAVPDNFGMVAFVLAVLAIPVFDTLRVMTARIVRGGSPFNPDKTHLHHLLLDYHFSHIGTTAMEIISNLLVIGVWYLEYRLGASVDLQLYVVIVMGMLITFAFYRFARVQQRKETRFYKWLTKVGDWTHVGHTLWFGRFRDFLDKGC